MVLLTLGTILLVQAATFATVSHYRKKFNEDVAVELTATTIRTLRAALAEIPAEQRARFVQIASENQWRLWSRSLPPDASLEERRPPPRHRHGPPSSRPPNDIRNNLRAFVDALNKRLDDDTRVALSRGPEPRLYISLLPTPETEDGRASREWLVIRLDRLAPPVSTPMIAVWLGGMGLLLLLSAAFSWHITRPLTRLARAADQLAAGQPQRVTPSGPTETRILGERFNAMLDTLAETDAVHRTLLAGLPHDLKGPLSRMWLRIEMLDDAHFKDGMRKDLQDMQRMVDQFIGFVRGTDRRSYQFEPLPLNAWLEEQLAAWTSTGSDVRYIDAGPENLVLNADRVALGRLLDNLITNAFNHGKPPVEVRLAADKDGAVITVSDHGPGIRAERRAEALRPFSRLDDARTRTGSVGLGLALAEAIVRAHGGSLALEDAAAGGLQVSVRLPLARP
ncbi:HAMP domain-containing protein [Parapusillimonas granuli]|uniref:histidine kinase n=2 Tax=Parapusillimonas granuli TaxID=380911 RepID=A0A853FZB9_9BURK|nr:HAMP domain-containing protein [Parapusillimonas granuli]